MDSIRLKNKTSAQLWGEGQHEVHLDTLIVYSISSKLIFGDTERASLGQNKEYFLKESSHLLYSWGEKTVVGDASTWLLLKNNMKFILFLYAIKLFFFF